MEEEGKSNGRRRGGRASTVVQSEFKRGYDRRKGLAGKPKKAFGRERGAK